MFGLTSTNLPYRCVRFAALAAWVASGDRCVAETISAAAYTIDIRNSLSFSVSSEDPVMRLTSARMSVLQRMNAASKPFIKITNISGDLALTSFQVDLSNSASMVTDVQWLAAPGRTGWNWNAASLSAFLQFVDPLLPGQSATMRLATRAQPGKELDYKMNQTLLHPCIGDCFTQQPGFGVLSMYSLPVASLPTGRSSLGPDGQPQGQNLSVLTLNLGDYPLTQEQLSSPSASAFNVVAVPEPGTVILAASALVVLVVGSRFRAGRKAA